VLNTGIHNGLLTVRRASPITTLLRMSLVRDAGKRDRQDTARRKEANDIGTDHLSLTSLVQSARRRRPSPFSPIVWPLSVNRQGGVTRYRAASNTTQKAKDHSEHACGKERQHNPMSLCERLSGTSTRATIKTTVHSDQLRSEYFEPRGLYAPESHRKRNLSNIARVIRASKGPYPGFRHPPHHKWDGFGEHT
jgi:hypothetical protein